MRAAAALDVERLRDAGLVVEAGFAAVELSAHPDAEAGAAELLGTEGLAVAGVALALRPWEQAAVALAALETALDAIEELAGDDRALVPLLVAATDDDERAAAAGEVEQHRYLWTRGAALGAVLDATHRAADRCRERGLVPAFLPRPGSAIESPREIDALAGALDLDLVRLALDVEGLRRAGGEPPAFVGGVRGDHGLRARRRGPRRRRAAGRGGLRGLDHRGRPARRRGPRIGARTARRGRRRLTPRRIV